MARSRDDDDARESKRIRETTPSGPRIPQSSPSDGEGESGTGDYGVDIGAGRHRGFGPDEPPKPGKRSPA